MISKNTGFRKGADKMTSKEALEILGDIPLGNNNYHHFSNYELKKVYSIEYETIKKDLDVLEILKENYKGAIKRANYLMINDMDLVDARDVKVKEWLEQ
jgi:hypothetical protein